MLNLLDLAHSVAKNKLYSVESCVEDFQNAVIAHYTQQFPECGVTNCFSLQPNVEIGIATIVCIGDSVSLQTPDCNTIYVNRL
jgi:hypothetical protein